jgi:formylglycine-generating enzyme required for sulfatase activity
MVWIPAGTFLMGSDNHYPEEAPAHKVTVTGFYIDVHTVTNSEFARFVARTGYVTVAERPLDPLLYPGACPELAVPGGLVFRKPRGPVALRDLRSWWSYVPGASWRHPEGPGSSISGRADFPVVQIANEDAAAYATWAGKSLPTEAEWEFAARSGLEGAVYEWGDELTPGGRHRANTWQGQFPWHNECADGHEGLAPVKCYPCNGYGLYDMTGNVWEWTTDWYRDRHEGAPTGKSCCMPTDPRGPGREGSYDPAQPTIRIPRKVLKGGSFLCSPDYCRRYRPGARYPQMIDTASCHIGFRCVARVPHGSL